MIALTVWGGLAVLLVLTTVIASRILSRDDMPTGRQPRRAQLRPRPDGYRYDRPETVQFSRAEFDAFARRAA